MIRPEPCCAPERDEEKCERFSAGIPRPNLLEIIVI
jgi:hypothetical protein